MRSVVKCFQYKCSIKLIKIYNVSGAFWNVISLLIFIPIYENKRFDNALMRVVAGSNVTMAHYPYVVAVVHKPFLYRICTGSLITKEWVLTAAHCFQIIGKQCFVRYGDLTKKHTRGTYRDVLDVLIAPNFRKVAQFKLSKVIEMPLTNDIALVNIEGINVAKMGKVSAIDYKSLVGRQVQYVGIGFTSRDSVIKNDPYKALVAGSKDERRPAQIGSAVIVTCPKLDSDELKTNAALLCVRPLCSNRYQRIQSGDSGGPLLFKGKIIGVACTVKHVDLHHEAMFTATSPYLDWIHDRIADKRVSIGDLRKSISDTIAT